MFIIMYIKEGRKKGSHCKINNREKKRGKYLHVGAENDIKWGAANIYIKAQKSFLLTLCFLFFITQKLCDNFP